MMDTLDQLRRGALAGARRLDLSSGLQQIPPEVFELADSLEILNLSGNQLSDLPDDLPRLKRLKVLFCSDNQFTHLPEVLGACPALDIVGFKANRIAHVPGHALPPSLRWLILTDNALGALPVALGERPSLQKLMLAGNRLQTLPDSLAQADKLALIRLSANQMSAIPEWLTRLPCLSWLALAGNPLGWHRLPAAPIPSVDWTALRIGPCLGEGASGQIFRVATASDATQPWALKLFKGDITSDGLPEHELAACLVAGAHPHLSTPVAELRGHPERKRGLLLPLIPDTYTNLAGPPSLDSCTRGVYANGFVLSPSTALRLARQVAQAVGHLHARGVMHGDLYAHNVLWNPLNGDAVLGDLGAATLLPVDDETIRSSLQALDVRAFGTLLEELLAHSFALSGTAPQFWVEVMKACLNPLAAERPSMQEVASYLAAVDLS